MPRVLQVLSPGEAQDRPASDTLVLGLEQRQRPHGVLTGINGTRIEFAEPFRLRADDRLLLDDGSVVEIVAEPEPLLEVRASDLPALARLAWHLGDRHVAVQILERRLRLRRDPAIEQLLARLGAKAIAIEAPFEPEGGAYETAPHHHHHAGHAHHHAHDHHHNHDHDHDHDHDHRHDDHGPGHGAHKHGSGN